MGQKIHPVGLRLGITRTWESRWFEKKNYKLWLHEDGSIRKYFGRLTRAAAISKVEIERRANQARVIVHTAKPGIIIGKRGVGIEDIRKNLERLTQKNVQVNVVEIKHPELDARLVGQNIVDQLEKRIAFRRAMKQAIMRTMKAGARGIKVQVSGRLGGAEIARTEQNHDGKVPLHTLRADIDYAHVEAFTTFGRIGCKVWIYKGEVLPDQPRPEARSATVVTTVAAAAVAVVPVPVRMASRFRPRAKSKKIIRRSHPRSMARSPWSIIRRRRASTAARQRTTSRPSTVTASRRKRRKSIPHRKARSIRPNAPARLQRYPSNAYSQARKVAQTASRSHAW